MATLYEHMAQGSHQNKPTPTTTALYLGRHWLPDDCLERIKSLCSERTLFLLDLASKDLGGFEGKLPLQNRTINYDSEDYEYDGYDEIDEQYNDDHLDEWYESEDDY